MALAKPDALLHLRDVVPGLLTLTRLPLAVLFVLAIDTPLAAVAIVLAAGLSDVADGWSARALGRVTPTGAWLDVVADKAFALTVTLTLLVHEKLTIAAAVLLGAREWIELPLVAVFVFQGAVTQDRAPASAAGKLTTALQFATFVALLLGTRASELLLGATAASGVVAAAGYWARMLRRQGS